MHDLDGATTPDLLFDALRDDPELNASGRDAILDHLIRRFPPAELIAAARPRLDRLGGGDAEALIRVVEAFGDEELFQELARAIDRQPDLPAERAWEALALLEGANLIGAYPGLAERWVDLNEAVDDDASIEDLARQLEDDPDGPWLALQGLAAVEPEVRAEIIAGLADLSPGGPGLISFFRLLAFAHDPSTRWAALEALEERSNDEPGVAEAWSSIAETHPDPAVAERSLARVGDRVIGRPSTRSSPTIVRSLVTPVDGEGRASIVLGAREGDRWAGAAFLCHVLRGIVDVVGLDGSGASGLEEAFDSLRDGADLGSIEGYDDLAHRLLAGSLSLCGPTTTPALRYWVERTAGPDFRADPHPIPDLDFGVTPLRIEVVDPESLPLEETAALAEAVLTACPGWADASDLTIDLAREIALREVGAEPDPRRDAGAYRFFFEHRLSDRVELYQRMLLWNAAAWASEARGELARSAASLAWHLTDPQHAVPGHPFFVALTTLSLRAAAEAAARAGPITPGRNSRSRPSPNARQRPRG